MTYIVVPLVVATVITMVRLRVTCTPQSASVGSLIHTKIFWAVGRLEGSPFELHT